MLLLDGNSNMVEECMKQQTIDYTKKIETIRKIMLKYVWNNKALILIKGMWPKFPRERTLNLKLPLQIRIKEIYVII